MKNVLSPNAGATAGTKLLAGSFSHTGVRETNQDALAVRVPSKATELRDKGAVACIADGVSCSEHSEQASWISVTQFIEDYYSTPYTWGVKQSASSVLKALNDWLYARGLNNSLVHNSLVTTFSVAILRSNTAHLIHVGDSRIYRYRDGKIEVLTNDHRRHRFAGQYFLTRALGMDSHLQADYRQVSLQVGDTLLLVTDGISDVLNETRLEAMLSIGAESEDLLAQSIVEEALVAGSQDNCSCVLVKAESLPISTLEETQKALTSRVIPPALSAGNRLDHYVVRRVLYSGSRSHVYLASSDLDGRNYVLKAPSQNFAEDYVYIQGFIREGWVGEQLQHPSVMRIYPGAVSSPYLYHVCEWVEGISLRQWLHDNPMPSLEKVRTLIGGIVRAVRVFQRLGLYHRDLKPDNVMVDASLNVKLIDFGTVQVSDSDSWTNRIAEEGPVGDLAYLAPECWEGMPATVQSELYSLGVIAYELLTGKLPYDRGAGTRKDASYQSAILHREDLPLWLDYTLKKACNPRDDMRYQALSEFELALSKPDETVLRQEKTAPLIERNPLRFWKMLSAILALLLMCSLFVQIA